MKTFDYIKQVILDEIKAIKEEVLDSKLLAAAFLLAIIGLLVYLKPFPDRHVNFLSGYENSDWHMLANSAVGILEKNGIEVSVITTQGAVENVARLDDEDDDANAGFTYGLALKAPEASGVYSLGSIGYEPIWILYNKKKIGEITQLTQLSKYKVGLAPVQSGSYRIAKKLYEMLGIPVESNPHFVPDTVINNQSKLKNGEIDAVILVSTNFDPVTSDLLKSPNIAVFDFKDATAFAKQNNSFVTLTLPVDSISIQGQIPPRDINLLATTTSLVVKRSMHPDLQLALLMAAKDANRNSSNLFFSRRDEFPAYRDPSIPISPVAERFYDYGPPHAMRYLPYWLAGFVDRAWLLLLTIVALFYPLSKLNIHYRKYRFSLKEIPHYKELLEMEKRLQHATLSIAEKEEMLRRLNEINTHAIHGGVPISEEAAYFSFLNAIYLLKRKLENV
jgi:TRAP-type uncharacterized transport system substrate-binding protein